jgi:DNA repair protein RadC
MTAREVIACRPAAGTDRDLLAELLDVTADAADGILDTAGGLSGLLGASAEALEVMPAIGPSRVARLRAGIELVRRMLSAVELAKRTRIASSADLAAMVRPRLVGLQQEQCDIVLLNGGNDVVAWETLSRGSLSESPVYPREVVNRANRHHAAAFILIHNHPSGHSQPSAGDRMMTERMVEFGDLASIPLVDHVILGARDHFSFADHGLIYEYRRRALARNTQ